MRPTRLEVLGPVGEVESDFWLEDGLRLAGIDLDADGDRGTCVEIMLQPPSASSKNHMTHTATLGIFLPAFVFVAASGPLVPRIRRSPIAGAFLDGVNATALALMVVVTYQLGRAAIIDFTTIALALVSGAILFRFRLNSAWLVFGGGIAGWLLYG